MVAPAEQLSRAQRALTEGAWREAWDAFEAALAEEETPEALEGLGEAAWWLDRSPDALVARQRAYHLYRRRDDLAAARLATLVAVDHFSLRGERAVASGWFERAHHLIEAVPAAAEHGWLAAWEAHVALEALQSAEAESRSSDALAMGRDLGVLDLEMMALAQQGLLKVWAGDVDGGMRRLDEASAAGAAGELSDRRVAVTTHCYLVDACVAVGDFQRVAQWNRAMAGAIDCSSSPKLVQQCRVNDVPVLLWRGEWPRAEEHLQDLLGRASDQPAAARRAAVSLALLRRRQGRRDEAGTLLDDGGTCARGLMEPVATLARAELALEASDPATARDAAERLASTTDLVAPWHRARALELLVRAHLSLDEPQRARAALLELRTLAGTVATDAVWGYVHLAEGLLAAGEGRVTDARRHFDDAVQRFATSGAAFESARARLELARALAALGRPGLGTDEAAAALRTFARLGAAEADRARVILKGLEAQVGPETPSLDQLKLTRREQEIVRLLATGRDNHEIAQDLYLSVRTVERHVSSIYRALGVSGKAARALVKDAAIKAGLAPPAAQEAGPDGPAS